MLVRRHAFRLTRWDAVCLTARWTFWHSLSDGPLARSWAAVCLRARWTYWHSLWCRHNLFQMGAQHVLTWGCHNRSAPVPPLHQAKVLHVFPPLGCGASLAVPAAWLPGSCSGRAGCQAHRKDAAAVLHCRWAGRFVTFTSGAKVACGHKHSHSKSNGRSTESSQGRRTTPGRRMETEAEPNR